MLKVVSLIYADPAISTHLLMPSGLN